MPWLFGVTDPKDPAFDEEMRLARKTGKALAKPLEGLKSKDADERIFTANVLLFRYRTPRPGLTKTEPIPADESKLLLTALAEADWKGPVPPRSGQLAPFQLFYMLGLTPKDGWNPGKFNTYDEQRDAARAWLTEHARTYRVQRFVAQ
jgi:hypothetical protein